MGTVRMSGLEAAQEFSGSPIIAGCGDFSPDMIKGIQGLNHFAAQKPTTGHGPLPVSNPT